MRGQYLLRCNTIACSAFEVKHWRRFLLRSQFVSPLCTKYLTQPFEAFRRSDIEPGAGVDFARKAAATSVLYQQWCQRKSVLRHAGEKCRRINADARISIRIVIAAFDLAMTMTLVWMFKNGGFWRMPSFTVASGNGRIVPLPVRSGRTD